MIPNDIFKALADPTRRAIFEKLASGSMNAVTLRQGMEISQPAMSQHLSVLRNAKLVREERQGRFVNYEVDPEGLALIAEWLAKYRAYWPARIDALKSLLRVGFEKGSMISVPCKPPCDEPNVGDHNPRLG